MSSHYQDQHRVQELLQPWPEKIFRSNAQDINCRKDCMIITHTKLQLEYLRQQYLKQCGFFFIGLLPKCVIKWMIIPWLSQSLKPHQEWNQLLTSLTPVKFEWNFWLVAFNLILVIHNWGISYEIAIRWISLDLNDDKSAMVQVMAWCRNYLSQFWPRSMSPYGITTPQRVNAKEM